MKLRSIWLMNLLALLTFMFDLVLELYRLMIWPQFLGPIAIRRRRKKHLTQVAEIGPRGCGSYLSDEVSVASDS